MSAKLPLVIVLMGVAGSGKSTVGHALSQALGWPFRDADSFHPRANVEKMSRGMPLTDEDRAPWLAAIAGWIDARCEAGEPGIVSCSALKHVYRRRIVGTHDGVRLVYLEGDMALIGERLRARKDHFMPASLLASQFAILEPPRTDECALVISIAPSAAQVANEIIQQLGLGHSRRDA